MSAKDDLNVFFDRCAKEVRSNVQYIRQYVDVPDEEIKKIKIEQPNIDISVVVINMAKLAGYERKLVNGIRGETYQSTYTKQFDSPLTSLFFCFYRFLFIRRLNHEEYSDIAMNIVYNTFLRFMRYVDIEVLNNGKQVTSLLNLVLNSNLINEYQHAKKFKRYYENHKISYDDAVEEIDKAVSNGYVVEDFDDMQITSKDKLLYLVEYLTEMMPYEYEMHNELIEMLKGRRQELSEYSLGIIQKWTTENKVSRTALLSQAIEHHKTYIASLDLS